MLDWACGRGRKGLAENFSGRPCPTLSMGDWGTLDTLIQEVRKKHAECEKAEQQVDSIFSKLKLRMELRRKLEAEQRAKIESEEKSEQKGCKLESVEQSLQAYQTGAKAAIGGDNATIIEKSEVALMLEHQQLLTNPKDKPKTLKEGAQAALSPDKATEADKSSACHALEEAVRQEEVTKKHSLLAEMGKDLQVWEKNMVEHEEGLSELQGTFNSQGGCIAKAAEKKRADPEKEPKLPREAEKTAEETQGTSSQNDHITQDGQRTEEGFIRSMQAKVPVNLKEIEVEKAELVEVAPDEHEAKTAEKDKPEGTTLHLERTETSHEACQTRAEAKTEEANDGAIIICEAEHKINAEELHWQLKRLVIQSKVLIVDLKKVQELNRLTKLSQDRAEQLLTDLEDNLEMLKEKGQEGLNFDEEEADKSSAYQVLEEAALQDSVTTEEHSALGKKPKDLQEKKLLEHEEELGKLREKFKSQEDCIREAAEKKNADLKDELKPVRRERKAIFPEGTQSIEANKVAQPGTDAKKNKMGSHKVEDIIPASSAFVAEKTAKETQAASYLENQMMKDGQRTEEGCICSEQAQGTMNIEELEVQQAEVVEMRPDEAKKSEILLEVKYACGDLTDAKKDSTKAREATGDVQRRTKDFETTAEKIAGEEMAELTVWEVVPKQKCKIEKERAKLDEREDELQKWEDTLAEKEKMLTSQKERMEREHAHNTRSIEQAQSQIASREAELAKWERLLKEREELNRSQQEALVQERGKVEIQKNQYNAMEEDLAERQAAFYAAVDKFQEQRNERCCNVHPELLDASQGSKKFGDRETHSTTSNGSQGLRSSEDNTGYQLSLPGRSNGSQKSRISEGGCADYGVLAGRSISLLGLSMSEWSEGCTTTCSIAGVEQGHLSGGSQSSSKSQSSKESRQSRDQGAAFFSDRSNVLHGSRKFGDHILDQPTASGGSNKSKESKYADRSSKIREHLPSSAARPSTLALREEIIKTLDGIAERGQYVEATLREFTDHMMNYIDAGHNSEEAHGYMDEVVALLDDQDTLKDATIHLDRVINEAMERRGLEELQVDVEEHGKRLKHWECQITALIEAFNAKQPQPGM